MLLYLVAYIDRANISVAALRMNADLGLTTRMYGIAVGLFYVTYVLLEVPSNLILARVGARRWIARIMVSWGLVAAGMGLVHTPTQLYIMRLLLGAAEAGFTPGIIYYLSCWYPRSDRARAMSFFYIGATLASVVGLPLSGTLLKLHGVLGLAGWRWLFLLEGLPAVVLGVVVLRYLPDVPAKAPWLSDTQKAWLIGLLRKEADNSPVSHSIAWQVALRNYRVWLLALFWFLQAFATIGITVFLPLIVRSVSTESDLVVTLLSALPFLFACAFMYLNGRHSDRSGERAFHLGRPADRRREPAGRFYLLRKPGSLVCAARRHDRVQLGGDAGVLGRHDRVSLRHRRRSLYRLDQRHREHLRRGVAAADGIHQGHDQHL